MTESSQYLETSQDESMRHFLNDQTGTIEGLKYLARIVEAELNLQQARRDLAVLIPERELASESALRYCIDEQEASDLFLEAINIMPYGEIYIGGLLRRLPPTAEGFGIGLVSSEPLKVCFTYEPTALD